MFIFDFTGQQCYVIDVASIFYFEIEDTHLLEVYSRVEHAHKQSKAFESLDFF